MTTRIVFYDGGCGLCHGAVKFILPRDTAGVFSFAPLGGRVFVEHLGGERSKNLPDSIVLLMGEQLYVESDAAIQIMRALRQPWPLLAQLLGLVPKPLRDAAYRFVARKRKRFFKQPQGICPIVSEEYHKRFLV